ncbi:putative nuclease HARBI1 [Frankliniella occidentalis]|uniref:Nuclease HARBI1 n=1 Tax=Frankliniella occidentalis TaxID=133901 RepID=A0A9C6XUB5_FRAOC|nr:putative nuclease HARBI1 [Frankliniella occidentalis]
MSLSSFHKKIVNEGPRSIVYEDRFHLVGDKAYPNRCWLMAPYKDYGNLTRQQKKYNYHHSVTRVVIEHTFGLLKGRWRRLLALVLKDVAEDTNFILAACVLHNFCYLHNDKVVEEMHENIRRVEGRHALEGLNDARSKEVGTQKRQQICDMI